MEKYSPKIDSYIEKSQDFAKPILHYIRETVHECCPDAEETMKWSFPHFIYKGKNLCAMASFKQHCTFGFWLEKEMKTMQEITQDIEKNSMFSLGKITKIEDLPSKPQLKKAIKEAMELTDMGVTMKKAAPSKTEVEIPDYFLSALQAQPAALHGLLRPKPKLPEIKEWSRLWNGLQKVRAGTGSTKKNKILHKN